MADHGDQLAHRTQPQPNQDERTRPRSSHPQVPLHPKEPRNQEPRREGHSQHGNSKVENQDSRQDENVAVLFNPLVIKW